MRAGDLVQVSAPRGSFTLAPGSNPVVMLSAGIGATPVLSMLHALAADEESARREIWWCYGARNGMEHPFANEVQSLLARLPKSHSLIAYSKPDSSDQLGRDFHAVGHLSLSSLEQLSVPKTADFYLCGPDAFLKDLTSALKEWDVARLPHPLRSIWRRVFHHPWNCKRRAPPLRIRLPEHRERDRSCLLRAAASRRPGMIDFKIFSNSRKLVTCRSAGPAGSVSATHANRGLSTAPSVTLQTPSILQRKVLR